MCEKTQRIAKAIAASGRASRREAERLIEAGRVKVNSVTIHSSALNVTASDVIELDGEQLFSEPLRLWLFYKPAGLITTSSDEKGRKTIYDELPPILGKVNPIGRLDLNSEGLLLLTNNGDLKRKLELPSTAWRRKYRVRAYGKAGEAKLDRLREGIVLDGERFRPMEVELEREQGDNAWYSVALREGKNREVRRAFEAIGLQVNRLIRVSYGPFQLGTMKKGEVSEMRPKALRTLLGGHIPEDVELAQAALSLENPEKPKKPKANQKSTNKARNKTQKKKPKNNATSFKKRKKNEG